MFVSMIIVFREAMEAGLIVGIVLAATEGVARRARWIAGGVAAGVVGASLVAAFAAALSNAFEGAGQEVFTAAILGFAVVMLSWHILWMSRHASTVAAEVRKVGQAVRLGQRSLAALGAVVAVAVMREGSEVVLFLYGIVAASHTAPVPLAIWWRGWLGARLRRFVAAVSRSCYHPVAPSVQRDQRTGRAARRRHGRPGGRHAELSRSAALMGAAIVEYELHSCR